MFWMKPTETARRPGNPGVALLLLDVSGSMSDAALTHAQPIIKECLDLYPSLRVFTFLQGTSEITAELRDRAGHIRGMGTMRVRPDISLNTSGTAMGHTLASLAHLEPQKTVVVSDGGACDKSLLFRTADEISGSIDAYYCEQTQAMFDGNWREAKSAFSPETMQKLARRGGGRFVRWHYLSTDLRSEFRESFKIVQQRRIHQQQLPDQHIYLRRRG